MAEKAEKTTDKSKSARQQKLAEALRANLKRRKAQAKARGGSKNDGVED